jgi:phospholipid/cholesterol/gamma-HCH transport system permease protein
MNVVGAIRGLGFSTLHSLARLGEFLFFTLQVSLAVWEPPFRPRRYLEETWLVGVLSFVIIAISGFAVGMVLGLQGYNTLVRFGAENALGTVVGLSLIRELGPVLTGLLVTGRAGSATAAGIASMVTTEQLDGLRMMSINPLQIVVAPKALSMILIMPILTAIFVLCGLAGSYLVGVEFMGLDSGAFVSGLRESIRFGDDIGACYLKAVLFGALAGFIATFQGYSAEPNAEGVSRATTSTVVFTSVAILISDYFVTALWGFSI